VCRQEESDGVCKRSQEMSDGGKGSAPRPKSVALEKFDEAWDRIFKSREKVRVSGVPYEVKPEDICCHGDCNEGRDCPLRGNK
jgi:hypothetical protein